MSILDTLYDLLVVKPIVEPSRKAELAYSAKRDAQIRAAMTSRELALEKTNPYAFYQRWTDLDTSLPPPA